MPTRPEVRLDNNPFGRPSFQYPLDLGSDGEEPFTIIQIRETLTGGNAQGGPRSLGTIALPIPRELRARYGAQYDEVSVGINDIANQLSALGAGSVDNLARGGANVVDTLTQANALNAVELFQGQIINPHMAVLFQGVDFRTFNFEFRLIAKNAQESESIRQIISTLKFHMHPKIPEDAQKRRFMIFPQNFAIGFFSPATEFLFRISLCVLTDCEANYTGSGEPVFFGGTGAPMDIILSLGFKEIEIMHQDRIRQGF